MKSSTSHGSKVDVLIICIIVVGTVVPNALKFKALSVINSSMGARCCFYGTSIRNSHAEFHVLRVVYQAVLLT
jgi:hypothetical protein